MKRLISRVETIPLLHWKNAQPTDVFKTMRRFTITVILFCSVVQVTPVKPIFDLANNMRLVLLPSDTNLGTIIYKLRAQDADENYPLSFTAYDTGQNAKTGLIDILNTDCSKSVCEADVVLMQPLVSGLTYEFSLEIKDTKGETTMVESKLQATDPLGPFVGAPRVVMVPENTTSNTLIESFLIRVNPSLYRGISCRLYPKEAREFFKLSNGFQTNLKDLSRCELKLAKQLDFEAKSAFVLRIVAENAWTNPSIDTRNVAVHEFIVEVGDVPDNPPYFLEAPPITKLPESAKIGDKLFEVAAFDGDYAHPRRIRYGLDPNGLPYSPFFDINPDTGVVTLRKSLQELDTIPSSPISLRIIAEEMNGNIASDRTSVEVALIIEDVVNRKPQFLKTHYMTSLPENALEGTPLIFEGGMDEVRDLDKGDNGILKLYVVGHEDTFEISPSIINHEGKFVISVKNSKKIDFELQPQMNFKIVAEEVGLSGLSATAEVTVNLIDENDNVPKFDKNHYAVTIPESVLPGTVVLQVKATDGDSGQNGEISYTDLVGDDTVIKSFSLDPFTGQIKVKENHQLDREMADEHSFNVVATDGGGKSSQVEVTVHLEDANDTPPKFKKRIYQGFMTPDLTKLRNDLQVEAVDGDQSGTRNSHISYEIINGNYDKKFSIDKNTGRITVNEPLTDFLPAARMASAKRRSRSDFDFPDNDINPVITLTVRAYDDGIPSLDAEVPVHIFTEDVSSRMMRFIIPQDPDTVGENQDKISDLIATMTGGDAEIQDIQPYFGDGPDAYTQLDFETLGRSPKTVSSELRSRRSLVDVLLRYPANSVVDINAVTSKLVTSNGHVPAVIPPPENYQDQISKNKSSELGGVDASEGKVTHIEILEQKNAALFWGLVILCLIIALIVIILLLCFCCPGCYYYRKDNRKRFIPVGSEEGEIKVLTVKNGEGQELKEARFVEIMRSARERLKSATSLGPRSFLQSDRVQRLLPDRREDDELDGTPRTLTYRRPNQIQVFDPHYRDADSIVIVRDYPPPPRDRIRGRANPQVGPRVVETLEELDVGSLARSDDTRTIYYGRRVPTERGKIFKVIDRHQQRPSRHGEDDVQILRLDEETRREETFQKIGDSEILNLDSGDEELSDEVGAEETETQNPSPVRQMMDRSPVRQMKDRSPARQFKDRSPAKLSRERPMAPRRSRSEIDLNPDQQNLMPEFLEGEFYTAVGPDGKEIILRRYLNDQTPRSGNPGEDRGFLNLVMNHLQQEHDQSHHHHHHNHNNHHHQNQTRKHKRHARYESSCSSNDEESDSSDDLSEPRERKPKKKKHKGTQSSPLLNEEQSQQDPPNLTPKHHIRSPILEETESSIEAELKSQGTNNDRYWYRYTDPDASYRFRINDGGRASPEPAYTETKASILRRRNTMAKLMQEEEKQLQGGNIDERLEKRLQSRNRHWSLNDLPNFQRNEQLRDSHRKRWTSVSNDELTLREEERARNQSQSLAVPNIKFNGLPKGGNLPKTSQNHSSEPRKFSKFVPNKFRRSTDAADRYQVYLKNHPDERYRSDPSSSNRRDPLWVYRPTKNIELHHVADSPARNRSKHAHHNIDHADHIENQGSAYNSNPSSGSATRSNSRESLNEDEDDDIDDDDEEEDDDEEKNAETEKKEIEKDSSIIVQDTKLSRPPSHISDFNGAEHLGDNDVGDDDDDYEDQEQNDLKLHGPKASIIAPRYMNWYNTSGQQTPNEQKRRTAKDSKQHRNPSHMDEKSKIQDGPPSLETNQQDESESGISSLSAPDSQQRKLSTSGELDTKQMTKINFEGRESNSGPGEVVMA